MENQEGKQLAKPKQSIQVINGNLQMRNVEDLYRVSTMFFNSGMCPQHLDSANKVAVVLQGGAELGFKPWQSLQVMHVVNGRLGMEGSAMLAKMRASAVCEYISMTFEGKPYDDEYRAIVKSKRRDQPVEYMTDFSVDDAKRAGLWGKKDNWNKYPKDMLTWRAVSRHARRYYSDKIWAMYTPEELENIENVPLDESFEGAQERTVKKIESEQGSEPVDAEFEAPQPEAEEKPQKTKKKATKKTAKTKADPTKFLYVCKSCGVGFNEPKISGEGATAASICPNAKCLSKNIISTEDEKKTPEFMEEDAA